MGLIADLGSGPVALDSAIFIYYIEDHRRFVPLVDPLFREADAGVRQLVTSALTLLEVLVIPSRAGDHLLANRYERLLTGSRGIRLVDLSRAELRAAARLRGATGMKTPGALQLAAAIGCQCRTFLTNDRRIPRVPGIQVRQLSAYLS